MIVIDDGSIDSSADVIRSFGEAIRTDFGPNRGGCAARNRGIELSRGELIQFLDADDLLDSNKLELQVPRAIADAARVVYCDWRFIDPANATDAKEYSPKENPADAILLLLQRLVQTSSPLHWKHDLVRVGGFTQGLRAAQEFDLHLRLAAAGLQFSHLPQVLYSVRRVKGSVSDNYAFAVHQQLRVMRKAFHSMRQAGLLSDERSEAFAGLAATLARGCLTRGETMLARRFLATARNMHPSAGLRIAYQTPSRMLRSLVGPAAVEAMTTFKRRIVNPESQ